MGKLLLDWICPVSHLRACCSQMGTTAKPGSPRLRTLVSSLLLLLLGARGKMLGWDKGSPQGFSFSSVLRGREVILQLHRHSCNLRPNAQLQGILAMPCQPSPGWDCILHSCPLWGLGNKTQEHKLTNVFPACFPCRGDRQSVSGRQNPRRTLSFHENTAGVARAEPHRGRGRRLPANAGSWTAQPSRRSARFNVRLSETGDPDVRRQRLTKEQYNALSDRDKRLGLVCSVLFEVMMI